MVLFLESSKAREGSIVHWILAVRPERAASSFETFRLSNDLRLLYFRRRVLHKYRRRHSEGNLIKVTSVGREYKGFLFSFANYFCLFRIFSDSILHKGYNSYQLIRWNTTACLCGLFDTNVFLFSASNFPSSITCKVFV